MYRDLKPSEAVSGKFEKYKLCFVDHYYSGIPLVSDMIAYFTDNMREQWGDDWDDAPYDCNAGGPYANRTNVIGMEFSLPLGLKVMTPAKYNDCYWSVQDINMGAIPWIYGKNDVSKVSVHIDSGTSPKEFIKRLTELYIISNNDFLNAKFMGVLKSGEKCVKFGEKFYIFDIQDHPVKALNEKPDLLMGGDPGMSVENFKNPLPWILKR